LEYNSLLVIFGISQNSPSFVLRFIRNALGKTTTGNTKA
jgi:hypothetical protein